MASIGQMRAYKTWSWPCSCIMCASHIHMIRCFFALWLNLFKMKIPTQTFDDLFYFENTWANGSYLKMIEEDKEAIIELLHGNTRDLSVTVVMCDDIDETCANDKSKKISNMERVRECERATETPRACERYAKQTADLSKTIKIYSHIFRNCVSEYPKTANDCGDFIVAIKETKCMSEM